VLLEVPYVERYGFGFSAHAHIAAANYGRSAFIMITGHFGEHLRQLIAYACEWYHPAVDSP
jgi:hypothetical protein